MQLPTSRSRRSAPASCRPLDDELAKDSGTSSRSTRCATRIREDLEHELRHEVERDTRADLLQPARHAGHLRRAGLAARSRDRPPRRGVRPPADRAADRPDEDQHQLGRVPGAPARRRGRGGQGGAGARRGRPAGAHGRHATPRSTPKSSATPNGPGRTAAGGPGAAGEGGRDLPACMPACGARNRSISFSARRRSSRRVDPPNRSRPDRRYTSRRALVQSRGSRRPAYPAHSPDTIR